MPRALVAMVGVVLAPAIGRAQPADVPWAEVVATRALPERSGPTSDLAAGSVEVWVFGAAGPLRDAPLTVALLFDSGASRDVDLLTGAAGNVTLQGIPVGEVRSVVVSGAGASERFVPPERGGFTVVLRATGDAAAGLRPADPHAMEEPPIVEAPRSFPPPQASGPDETQPAGTLSVWVMDRDGVVAGVRVQIGVRTSEGLRETILRTTAQGFARFHGVPTDAFVSVSGEMTSNETVRALGPVGYHVVLRTPSPIGALHVEGGRFAPLRPLPRPPPEVVAPAPAGPPFGLEDARALHEDGTSLRMTGQIFTLVGSALTVAAVSVLLGAFGVSESEDALDFRFLAGWGSLAVGIAGLAVGIPFWAIGGQRVDRAERMGFQPAD